MTLPTSFNLELPSRLVGLAMHWRQPFVTPEQRMQFMLALARCNLAEGGGPFAAAIFEHASRQLVAIGANRVVAGHASIAHAEMMAIALAQQALMHYDLGTDPEHEYELVTSCEPCAMCFGALSWSGIRHLVCGAYAADARAIGFDEGPRHPDWITELESRGISVQRGVLHDEAVAVLNEYGVAGGEIYNGRQG